MPLNIDWHQILIHLFNFFLLLAVLNYFLYEPVLSFMKKREEHYKVMDRETEKKLREANNILEENKHRLENSDQEIKLYRDKQIQETSSIVKEKLDMAKEQEIRIISEAKKKAEIERHKIVESAHKDIKSMAINMTKKLIKNNDTDMYDDFIESSLSGDEKDE